MKKNSRLFGILTPRVYVSRKNIVLALQGKHQIIDAETATIMFFL